MSINILETVWNNIVIESRLLIHSEPVLSNFLNSTVFQHSTFKDALVYMLSMKLDILNISLTSLIHIFNNICKLDNNVVVAAAYDIYAMRMNDPAITKYITPFLYLKGFHALQLYRITHWLWNNNQLDLAMYLYSYITIIFNVDIHPAAKIGHGIMLDHATGVVIGETAVVENNVTIMQSVTLGSTGKIKGDRHPKIRHGVLIGAGSIILGNIEIGCGSKIGAGSVVLYEVPPYSTVTGKPATLVK